SIDGQIGSLSADDILRQCFEENVTVFCDAVTTGPGGQIQGVVRQFENLGKFETRGIDLEAPYRTSVSRSADLNFRVLANYTDKLATTAATIGILRGTAGEFGTPHWTIVGTARYQGERFGAGVDLRWYEGGAIDNRLIEGEISRDGININNVESTLYTNVSLDYDLSEANTNGDLTPSFPPA